MVNRTIHQQRIDEFMRKAGQEVPESPCIPSAEVRLLRAKLIMEEALETIEGLGFNVYYNWTESEETFAAPKFYPRVNPPDLELIADGCADLSVVTIGTLSACGISDEALLAEVDAANLAKFEIPRCLVHGNTMAQVKSNWPAYRCTKMVHPGVRCGFHANGPYRRDDGKWVKGPDWTPPNIARVLNEQTPTLAHLRGKCCGQLEAEIRAEINEDREITAYAPNEVLAPSNTAADNGAEIICDQIEAEILKDRYPEDLLVRAKEHLIAIREFGAAEKLASIIRNQKAADDGVTYEQ